MTIDAVALGLVVAGGAWGVAADRIGARWPAHEDGSIRPIDWRTVVVVAAGAIALAGVSVTGGDLVARLVFGAYAVALVLLLATDLDQRLLPDIVTLPAIPIALAFDLAGLNPLVPVSDLPFTLLVTIAIPAVFFLLSIPFGEGAIGIGDLKLLLSAGLLAGGARIVSGVAWGAFVAGITIAVLLVARRVTLRTYIPFGPFLIAGALWAILGVR
ncbi:MAG: prepilin peptidase [Chloroflexota bacterium]